MKRCIICPPICFRRSLRNGGKANVAQVWDNERGIIINNDVRIGYEAVVPAGITSGYGASIGTQTAALPPKKPHDIMPCGFAVCEDNEAHLPLRRAARSAGLSP